MYHKEIIIEKKVTGVTIEKVIERLQESTAIKEIITRKDYLIGAEEGGNDFIIRFNNYSSVNLEIRIEAKLINVVEGIAGIIIKENEVSVQTPINDYYTVINEMSNDLKIIKSRVTFSTVVLGFFAFIWIIALISGGRF